MSEFGEKKTATHYLWKLLILRKGQGLFEQCVCDVSHSVAQEMLLKEDVVNETGQKKGKKGNPFMTDPHQINTLRRQLFQSS